MCPLAQHLPTLSDAQLDLLLAEDVPFGDLTTQVLGIGALPGRMIFAARQPMVVAAVEDAARLLSRAGCSVEPLAASGDLLGSGAPILNARGPAAALHRGWKVAQVLVETASGIATVTRDIIAAATAVNSEVKIAGTRKTVPGAKALSISALIAGGAIFHRLGLSETILIFAEHRIFLGSLSPDAVVATVRHGAPEKKIVVEVSSVDEGVSWASAGADVILGSGDMILIGGSRDTGTPGAPAQSRRGGATRTMCGKSRLGLRLWLKHSLNPRRCRARMGTSDEQYLHGHF